MFRFFINNTLVNDQPEGWDAINSSVKREDETGVLVYDADIRLTSYGGQDLYVIIRNLWELDRYSTAQFRIEQKVSQIGYITIHDGLILLSDVKFNLINNSLEFKVEDNSYYSKINNNKGLQATLDVNVSKNELTITPTPSFNLRCFNQVNGNYDNHDRKVFRIYDVCKYLISFMSDNSIGFESSTFGTGGIYEQFCLMSGDEMANPGDGLVPRLSFEDLWTMLYRWFNVRMAIESINGSPILRIESVDYFYSNNVALTIPSIPDEVSMKVDTSLIYAKVKVGSTKYETTGALHYPDVYPLASYKEREFNFKGTNNIDRTLDLTSDFVASNAVIDICYSQLSGYETYKDDVIILSYHKTGSTYYANQITEPLLNVHLYNSELTNASILSRWSNYVPNDATNYFYNTTNDGFIAYYQNPPGYTNNGAWYMDQNRQIGSFYGGSLVTTIPFNDDYSLGNDLNNNYGGSVAPGSNVDPNNSYFTAPVDGTYTFTCCINIRYSAFLNPGDTHLLQLVFTRRDSSNAVQNVLVGNTFTVVDDSLVSGLTLQQKYYHIITLCGSVTIPMAATDTMEISVNIIPTSTGSGHDGYFEWQLQNGSYFSCDSVDQGGGNIAPVNPKNYKAILIQFNYPIRLLEYNKIRNSKTSLVKIPIDDSQTIYAWVKNLKFEHNSGETTFELITDGNTIYR